MMADLFNRLVAIFGTTAGMTVLALAGLALLGLALVVFWENIRLPRLDRADGGALDTAPPPLLAPEIVSRSAEGGWGERRTMIVRNALLLVIAVAFVAGGAALLRIPGPVEENPEIAREVPKFEPIRVSQAGTSIGEVALGDGFDGHLRPVDAFCAPGGSIAERFVSVCGEGKASVRLDLLRLEIDGSYVIDPVWQDRAPTFVTSESHAAPFQFGRKVAFVSPETVGEGRYDGYLVIGVGEAANSADASVRAEALRRYAVRTLAGGETNDCLRREHVFAATAAYLTPQEARVRRKADAAGLTVAQFWERETARLGVGIDEAKRLEAVAAGMPSPLPAGSRVTPQRPSERAPETFRAPAPIIVGISADPYSPNKVADMKAAAKAFLADHGLELQLSGARIVEDSAVCDRVEAKL